LAINDKCSPTINFIAKTGILITGKVSPPIKDVMIKASTLIASGELIEYVGKTDSDGKYRLGPVDDLEFEINANLADYEFKKVGKRDFSAVKVAMIQVGCKNEGLVKVVGKKGIV